VDIGDNPVNFKGAIGLDKSLDMTVTLPYTGDGRTVNIGKQRPGKRVSLRLEGSVYKPKLDTRGLIQDQIKDALFKGIDKLFKL
jgi:hypothetical protein